MYNKRRWAPWHAVWFGGMVSCCVCLEDLANLQPVIDVCGHLICLADYKQVTRCPVCRVRWGGHPRRVFGLEEARATAPPSVRSVVIPPVHSIASAPAIEIRPQTPFLRLPAGVGVVRLRAPEMVTAEQRRGQLLRATVLLTQYCPEAVEWHTFVATFDAVLVGIIQASCLTSEEKTSVCGVRARWWAERHPLVPRGHTSQRVDTHRRALRPNWPMVVHSDGSRGDHRMDVAVGRTSAAATGAPARPG
jgi:hypothetical protein